MSRIGKTIEDIRNYREYWLRAMQGEAPPPVTDPERPEFHLTEISEFGPNPGRLRLLAYVPERLASNPALVVVLHGCQQTAASYDVGSGWSELAAREGFLLCLPEQRSANNGHHCFNWFSPRSIARGEGEAASIRSMVEYLAREYGVDRSRIFVTGLSAGAAMSVAMLAAYPDVFAAGAAIAGLPYASAVSVGSAIEVMSRGDLRTGPAAAASVRLASSHQGVWPRLSVWHGTADTTVAEANAGALVRQWRHLNGLRSAAAREERVDGHLRRVWRDGRGRDVIEQYVLDGFGHALPLAQASLGHSGPFLVEAGISSTERIAEFFGLVPVKSLRRLLPTIG